MRISLFGGTTDYKSFYEKFGSFIIGTTIDKYAYNTIRFRPKIVGKESVVTYSQLEKIEDINKIKNPLIRETLKYYGIDQPIELNFASDIPSRTGLGGSSSCCVSLANSICVLLGLETNKTKICLDAIKIEREILKEAGGIQDQIWACYGGFNTITIFTNGSFAVSPVPVTYDFMRFFESSLMLIYSDIQRTTDFAAKSHDEKDKKAILDISKEAFDYLKKEDIKSVGQLLYQSWLEKRGLSKFMSNNLIDNIIEDAIQYGAYGAKLLGSGSGGFVLVICDRNVKKRLKEKYNGLIIDFQFESKGLTHEII